MGKHAARTMPPHIYRLIVESALDYAIFSLDMDGNFQTWNAGAQLMFGYGEGDVLGQAGAILWTPEDRELLQPEVEQRTAVLQGRAINERWHVRMDGTWVWGSGLMMPLREDGAHVGYVKIMRDKTLERQAEEERRGLLADLETTVAQLGRANAAKDELWGMVSHELRTPLTTVIGSAEVLHRRFDELDQDVIRSTLAEMHNDGRRLQGLVENMLTLGRITAGIGLAAEPLLLQRALPPFLARIEAADPARPIRLEVLHDLPPVVGHQTSVEQVLQNLVENARKYGAPGTPIVVRLAAEGSDCGVRVLDEGKQVTPEELQGMFHPFHRARPESANGFGLGLSVCRRLVEAQGGRIWARPRPSGGLEVGFTLPFAAPVTGN